MFDLLDIPLVHGWLVDPNLKSTAEAVGTFSYNQLVERIIENKNSKTEAVVTEGQFHRTGSVQFVFHFPLVALSFFLQYCLCVTTRHCNRFFIIFDTQHFWKFDLDGCKFFHLTRNNVITLRYVDTVKCPIKLFFA